MSGTLARLVLEDAENLLQEKQRWTYFAMARNILGKKIAELDSSAYAYCMSGAISVSSHKRFNAGSSAYVAASDAARNACDAYARARHPWITSPRIQRITGRRPLVIVNDYLGHAATLEMIRGAKQMA